MRLTDLAAAGHQDSQLKLHSLLHRGWMERHDGFLAAVQELPAPAFNAVMVYDPSPRDDLVDALERVRASGLPFSLSCRPGAQPIARALAARFGMHPQAGMPLMGLTAVPDAPQVLGLTLHTLGPEEHLVHARIAAEVFGAPLELTAPLAQPEMMVGHGAHFIGGDLNGETVTTAVVDVNGASAWIFNVATRAGHRRRGLGAAVTAAAARIAFAAGASGVFLLSTPVAERVYEKLGFTRLEWWSAWDGDPWT